MPILLIRCSLQALQLAEQVGSQNAFSAETIENTALFLRLGLPSTLIRLENGTFWKRFSVQRKLKTPASRFSEDEKHFSTELSETMTSRK